MRAANSAHALALVVVDEITRGGITDAVLAPGSRSAPLALALAEHPGVRLHVCIDERSAAFLGVGLARAAGRPAVVLSTSGTAAANFHPAVLEAHHARVPLLVFTADRPPELRDTGANQTIDQIKLYGDSVRWFKEVGVPESLGNSAAYWRSIVARARAAASGSPAGPVHLNFAFRDPLVPEGDGFAHDLGGRPEGQPWHRVEPPGGAPSAEVVEGLAAEISAVEKVLLVAGEARSRPEPLLDLADRAAMPVLAEASSGLRAGPNAISTYDALLRNEVFRTAHAPDLVLRVGKTGTSRALAGYLGPGTPQVLIDPDGAFEDPDRSIARIVTADPALVAGALVKLISGRAATAWLESWQLAEARARRAIDELLDHEETPSEPRSARDLAALLPQGASLVAASSMPIRDLDWFMAPRTGLRVISNRGVSGIDGFVSTAFGVALASGGTVAALAGDLSLLHDVNGLMLATSGAGIVFVVINNDGGGIFSFLPQARHPESFETVFGTPHGLDLSKVAAAFGCAHALVRTAGDLGPAVERARSRGGAHIVEVRTDRAANVDLHRRIWAAVDDALHDSRI